MKNTIVTQSKILDYLSSIEETLASTHNTVTTDLPGVNPTNTSWRIDNSRQIDMVNKLKILLT